MYHVLRYDKDSDLENNTRYTYNLYSVLNAVGSYSILIGIPIPIKQKVVCGQQLS